MGKWVVTSAWPYVNAVPHLGNLIGSVLSSDVFVRYLRLKGEDTVLVSGSDEHGTPIEVAAIQQGISPKELTDKNHVFISNLFKEWGITYDNYTRTHNPTHIQFTQEFYMKVYENGYIFTEVVELPYCPHCDRFLPDRFVEGICPHCGAEGARGDQCDKCTQLLEPTKLINPYCVTCKNPPKIRKSKHWYLDFPKFEKDLEEFIENNPVIPDNARNWCLSLLRTEGLKPRAITRDLKWGIPSPLPGSEGKSIYVWFEAVLGYISATKQWAEEIAKKPDKFEDYWFDSNTKTVFFIGKDNIPFHLLIFPALIMANGSGYVLPYNVSSTEFLMFEEDKFSKSRGVGIWIDEAIKLLPPDYWRYYLLAIRPETKDTSFKWMAFESKVNVDLNDVLGNFIHRTLSFISQNFDGIVPERKDLAKEDEELIKTIRETPKRAGETLERFTYKEALGEVMDLARKGNSYLSVKEPWHRIKENKDAAGTTLNLAIQVVRSLAILLSPFIPFTSKKIWELLQLDGDVEESRWEEASDIAIPAGHKISKPEPLFQKIDSEELKTRLEKLKAS